MRYTFTNNNINCFEFLEMSALFFFFFFQILFLAKIDDLHSSHSYEFRFYSAWMVKFYFNYMACDQMARAATKIEFLRMLKHIKLLTSLMTQFNVQTEQINGRYILCMWAWRWRLILIAMNCMFCGSIVSHILNLGHTMVCEWPNCKSKYTYTIFLSLTSSSE